MRFQKAEGPEPSAFSCKKAAHKMAAGAAKAVRRVCYSAHELHMAKESYGVQGKRACPVVWF